MTLTSSGYFYHFICDRITVHIILYVDDIRIECDVLEKENSSKYCGYV